MRDQTITIATLDAVLSGDRQPQIRKEAIDIGDRSPCDDSECAACLLREISDQRAQFFVDMHTRGDVSDFDQCAIEIEEPGPRCRWWWKNSGATRRLPVRTHRRAATGVRRGARRSVKRMGNSKRCSNRERRRTAAASTIMRPAQR